MTNGNSADPRILAEEWHNEFVNKFGHPPDAEDGYTAGYREALSVCADGGKDSSAARDMADFIAEDGLSEQFRIWRECRDAAIAGEKK